MTCEEKTIFAIKLADTLLFVGGVFLCCLGIGAIFTHPSWDAFFAIILGASTATIGFKTVWFKILKP